MNNLKIALQLSLLLIVSAAANAATNDPAATPQQPAAIGLGQASAGVDDHSTKISIVEPVKVQRATGAASFVPTPNTTAEFVINSSGAAESDMLDVYASIAAGMMVSTSETFSVTTTEVNNEEGDKNVNTLVTFAPIPGFQENTNENKKPASVAVGFHTQVDWTQKYRVIGVMQVDLADIHDSLFPFALQIAAQSHLKSPLFGNYPKIVAFWTMGSKQLRSGSVSTADTMGASFSTSGTPVLGSFMQIAGGVGAADSAVSHNDVPRLRLVVAIPDATGGRILPSYAQFESNYIAQAIEQSNKIKGMAPQQSNTGAQAVASGQAK